MSDRKLLLLVVVAVALLVIATLQSKRDDEPVRVAGGGPSYLIQGLDPSLIGSITVTEGDNTVTLQRSSDTFRVTDKEGYPAVTKEINRLINDCLDIKTETLVTHSASNHGGLEVSDENAKKKIEMKKADGEVLAVVIFGKTVTEPRSTYVRRTGSDEVYASTNVPYVRVDAMNYIDKQLCNAEQEKIVQVALRHGDDKYVLTKQAGKIALDTLPDGKQLKESDAKQTFEALAGLNCDDVHKSVEGLDFDHTFICSMEDSTVYTVKLAEQEDKTYATFSCIFTDQSDVQINPKAKDSEEELIAKEAKLLGREAAVKLNKRHEGWIYEIASWQADRLTKSQDDLLEDVPEEEPEAAAEESAEESAGEPPAVLGPVAEPETEPVLLPAIEEVLPAEEAPAEEE